MLVINSSISCGGLLFSGVLIKSGEERNLFQETGTALEADDFETCLKTCILSLSESATNTLPSKSVAILAGCLNWPSPVPMLPHLVRKLPLLSNFCIR